MEFLENQCNYTAPKIELAVYPTVESDEYTGKVSKALSDALDTVKRHTGYVSTLCFSHQIVSSTTLIDADSA